MPGSADERLASLFAEYLAAAETGRDAAQELLQRAGELGPALEAKIELERELRALSRELGMATRAPDAPRRVGRFQVLDSLAQTALSRVFLAFDPDVGRRIALKILDRTTLLDKDQGAWIRNEARALARIEHRAVVKVFEVGETGTHSYIAMELLPGPSLHELIREWARLRGGGGDEPPRPEVAALAARLAPVRARVGFLAELAEALAQCHDKGVLHRDLKPQNVLFDGDGEPRLIDFGLAHDDAADEDSQLGLTQALVGTAAYIAPEQVESDRTGADARSDQFSFGTLAYECFALENPFLRKNRRATLDAIAAADPPPLRAKAPDVPSDLALVIHHALVRDPAGRYPGMAVLAGDLRALLEHRPISVAEPSPARIARLWMRRHRRGITVASIALALALGTWLVAWGAAALRERGTIRAELARIRPDEFEGPVDFSRTFEPLLELQRRAAEFEGGLVRSTLWDGLADEVRGTVESWSRGLDVTHERELKESREQSVPFQDGIYRELFWQEAVLCPDCPYNLENRRRGRVVLPEEALAGREVSLAMLFSAQQAPPQAPVFRRTVRSELLIPGTYRLLVSERGARRVAIEAIFHVPEGWHPELAIDVHPPRPELLAASLPVARSDERSAHGRGPLVPSFRILDHLVTGTEFEVFLNETRREAKSFQSTSRLRSPEDPAWVDYDSAFAFARWAGGHLPSHAELRLAEASAQLVLLEDTPWASGEYLLDLFSAHVPSWIHYGSRTPRQLPSRNEIVRDNSGASVGFRVVFSDDEPEAYGLESIPR